MTENSRPPETKDQRVVRWLMEVRLPVFIGLWIFFALLAWAYGQIFGVAVMIGAIPGIVLDFVFALFYGAWNIFDIGRWLVQRLAKTK